MPTPTAPQLNQRLSELRGLNGLYKNALRRSTPPSTLRQKYTSYLFDLAVEHHIACAKCIEASAYGSAAALLRPILECGITSIWILYCAPNETLIRYSDAPHNIETLWVDEDDVPMMRKMKVAISLVPSLSEYAKHINVLLGANGNGKIFHKFTHPSMYQIKRRELTPERLITFTRSEVFGLMTLADFLSLACASVYQAVTQDHELMLIIKNRYDALLEELRAAGQDPPVGSWTPYPQSDLFP